MECALANTVPHGRVVSAFAMVRVGLARVYGFRSTSQPGGASMTALEKPVVRLFVGVRGHRTQGRLVELSHRRRVLSGIAKSWPRCATEA